MITYPNLYHLKYFVDAVALGSISGAAQKNLVTHPAISRAISSLEIHLGFSLLVHQKKAFQLTKDGHRVAEQARILLAAASDFDSLNLHSKTAETLELKIGLSRSLSDLFLNPILENLKAEFPHSSLKVRFGTTHQIVEAVAEGSIDIGLTIGTLNLPTLRQTVLRKGNFILVESGSPKTWNKGLESKVFVLTEPRPETERLKVAYKRHFDQSLPVQFEVSSWEVIGQLVQKGLGVGLLPDISIKSWKKGSFRNIKLPTFECPYEVYLHTPKSSPPNRMVDSVSERWLKGESIP